MQPELERRATSNRDSASRGRSAGPFARAEAESECDHADHSAIVAADPAQYLITTRYIESLRDMTRSKTRRSLHCRSKLLAMLASVGAIKEVFSQGEKSGETPPPPPKPNNCRT